MGNENKLKHLELIQNIITRMANNSFLLKGWSIAVVGAIIGLNKDGIDWKVLLISGFILLMFWVLDAYFLKQETIFRERYDEVRIKEENSIDFDMKLESEDSSNIDWFVIFFSLTLRLFYGSLLVAIFLFTIFL